MTSLKDIEFLKKNISFSINNFVNKKIEKVEDLFIKKEYSKENSYYIKRFYNSNDNSKIELKKITTNFITQNYFKSSNSLENFAIFCYDILSHSISEYCNKIQGIYSDLEPANLNDKIKVFLKGGNVLNAVFFKNIEYLSYHLKKEIIKQFSSSFNPSDFDFEIILSTNLSKKKEFDNELYDKIYSDLCHLLYFILNDIREYFNRFSSEIFDYPKYNNSLKKKLLYKLKKEINKSEYTQKNKLYLCKIIHDDLYAEEPCINDIRFDYENQYDHVVQSFTNKDQTEGNLVITPLKFDNIKSNPINNFYISINDSLDFIAGTKRNKFFLARMKCLFNLYFMQSLEWSKRYSCCEFNKIGGELIDVVVYHKDSTDKHRIEDLQSLVINNKRFLAMNEKKLILELHDIIFINFTLPWYQTKSEKRLKRYFGFSIIIFLQKYKSDEKIIDLVKNNIYSILIKFNSIMSEEDPLNYNNLDFRLDLDDINKDEIPEELNFIYETQVDLNELYQRMRKEISKIDKFDNFSIKKTKSEINENLKVFIKHWKNNFEFFLGLINNVLNKPILKDNVVNIKKNKYFIDYNNQLGGFNSCNLSNKEYVIPIIMKYFNKYTDKVLESDSLVTFRSLCKDLLNNIKNPGYFKSLTPYGDNPIPEISHSNYTVSITFFVFLSFMIEYFMFIIVYQNENLNNDGYKITFNYNTLNERRNNYENIWNWSGAYKENQDLNYTVYRKDIENYSIQELLNEFCLELDRLYYRFIITIIFNLKIYTMKDIEELKNIIFPPIDLRRKIKTTENKYEHIYPDWKKKVRQMTGIEKNTLEKIIKDSLISVTNHSSKIDNEYTPDATGLFSWMYLVPARFRKQRSDHNMSLKFGSCITNTYLENYLLIRINEKPEDVGVGLEAKGETLHKYWSVTQGVLSEEGENNAITHWFTIWKKNNTETFRESSGFVMHHLSKNKYYQVNPVLNIKNNQKKMILALICPIFDSYYSYCLKNRYPEMEKKIVLIKKFTDAFIDELKIVFP